MSKKRKDRQKAAHRLIRFMYATRSGVNQVSCLPPTSPCSTPRLPTASSTLTASIFLKTSHSKGLGNNRLIPTVTGNGTKKAVTPTHRFGIVDPVLAMEISPEYALAVLSHTDTPQAMPTSGAVMAAARVCRFHKSANTVGKTPGLMTLPMTYKSQVISSYVSPLKVTLRCGSFSQHAEALFRLIVWAMAAATKNLSFGVTASTTYENPFLLARKFATLDHLTKD